MSGIAGLFLNDPDQRPNPIRLKAMVAALTHRGPGDEGFHVDATGTVRVRAGVKPLYYVARASGFAFASELRALVRSGMCLPKLDEESVWRYLLYPFPTTDRTLLAGVLRLPAAHLLEWRADTPVRIERYASYEATSDEVATLLEDVNEAELPERVADFLARLDDPVGDNATL